MEPELGWLSSRANANCRMEAIRSSAMNIRKARGIEVFDRWLIIRSFEHPLGYKLQDWRIFTVGVEELWKSAESSLHRYCHF
jgi:hypothetical protein